MATGCGLSPRFFYDLAIVLGPLVHRLGYAVGRALNDRNRVRGADRRPTPKRVRRHSVYIRVRADMDQGSSV